MAAERHEFKIDRSALPEWIGGINCDCKDMQTATTSQNGEILHGVYCKCTGSGFGFKMDKEKLVEVNITLPFRLT